MRIITILITLLLLSACAGSPYRMNIEASQNRENMIKLNIGQTKDQVLAIMGQPYKTEMYVIDEKPIEFWLYLTTYNQRLLDSNFTPVAFNNGVLKGWGRNYYDSTLRIKEHITIEQK